MAEFIESKLEIVMFPWLAFGHLIPYMNLSNELAKRGHKISFLLPKNAEIRLQKLNLYPNLIKLHKLTIPHVDGLPYGAETTADVHRSLESLLATALVYPPPILDQLDELGSDFGPFSLLEKKQFQQLVLGFELTELPFLLVVKPPEGTNSVEEALPEGFKQRVQEKGLILDCWVPQLEILRHKSVGCFVTHCGYGSMWEALVLCDCQLVLLPRPIDHIFTARFMEQHLKVGVEVEQDENDLFTKENLCNAVKCVMDK
ncbi:UDP-glycosyltransferase 79B7-like, partial [Solanum stenotomum]|uniref:UDP-glycosyltransferase 79B7-like n=1 Tax=Solanum stenotomum TaxID=172797 RepID=UPI0020D12C7B